MGGRWAEAETSGSEGEEEDLDVSRQVAILIIGKSGSGKTYLTRSLVEQFKQEGKPTYVVNDRTRDKSYAKLSWDGLKGISDCGLVVEDLISAKPSEFLKLQELLNWQSHHSRVTPVIAISHSLLKNNIHGLLPFFNFIYIAAVKMNVTSFRTLLNYYCFEDEQRRQYMDMFLAADEQFTFFMFDVERRTIRLTRAEASVRQSEESERLLKLQRELEGPRASREAAAASAKKYLTKFRGNSDYALILFDLIYPSLPLSRFDAAHLAVTLLKDGAEVVISLIDYIAALLDEGQTPPDYYMRQFHRYLRRRNLHLPKTYVLNRHFWD